MTINPTTLRTILNFFPSLINRIWTEFTQPNVAGTQFLYTWWSALLCLCVLHFIIKLTNKILGKGGKL